MKFSIPYGDTQIALCELHPREFKELHELKVTAVPLYFAHMESGIFAWPLPAKSEYATAWESSAGYYWRIAEDGEMRMIIPSERLFDK